ncbi:high-affinity nickel permease [Liquorilactobacillus oeni DSM 19972]|uniref:Nickel/cobalt efflux system n=2 Tax=Liquorilactobacillus oeni TaxID=303241 RepID=A0A0R1MN13_9LACO|nr:high-affinity nickel permease [Liquorilactobacillus oeni DSM 19972]
MAARQNSAFWGLGLLSYTLGLRHAFDADHIAAIDNTVRKLVNQKRNAAGVGFYFSLGHSTIVIFLVLLVSFSVNVVKKQLPFLEKLGGKVGGIISGSFLLLLALANLVILINLYKTAKKVDFANLKENELDQMLGARGFLTRILAPLLKLINKSWQMYPIGFLFGLGFDTATEIALIALSAGNSQTAAGWRIIAFPLLFAAGMNLMDTTDSVMMTSAYRWAFATPVRKIYYNLTITSISVIAAFAIGSLELLQVAIAAAKKAGRTWSWLAELDFSQTGYFLVGIFLLLWILASVHYRYKTQSSVS